jgi:uncharacterized membrane protein YgdD (TMEM256/DUF423 family)
MNHVTQLDAARRAVKMQRVLGGSGALLALIAVALSAVIAHSGRLDGVQHDVLRASATNAALFMLLHGAAVTALAMQAVIPNDRYALIVMLVGTVLFSGSVIAGALLGTPAGLAPLGGSLLMLAWLWVAINRFWR